MTHSTDQHSINPRIGHRLRMTRRQQDLSVADLANVAGISEDRIREIEVGAAVITAEELVLLSSALLVPIEYFVHHEPLLDWHDEWQLLSTFRQLSQQQRNSLVTFVRDVAGNVAVTDRPA